MRAHRVLGDDQPLRDLLGAEVLVEEEQHLELAGRERPGDRLGNGGAAMAALAHLLEQAPRDLTGERHVAVRDPAQKVDDPLRRLALQ